MLNDKKWSSFLFVPAQQDRLNGAGRFSPDVYIFDLEDSVKEENKENALRLLGDFLSGFSTESGIFVRINNKTAREELAYLSRCKIDGIVIPKVEEEKQVEDICDLAKGKYVLALIETAMGMAHIEEIVKCGMVDAVAFGAEDYCAETGMKKQSDLLLPLRLRMVMYAAAYRKNAYDMVDVNYKDMQRYKEEVYLAKNLGFQGKLAIHPAQAEEIKKVYGEQNICEMKKIVEAYESNPNGFFLHGGKIYERPHIEQIEKKLQEIDAREQLVIVGTNTTAKQAYDFVKEYHLYEVVGFAVDKQYKDKETFCGLPVFELEEIEHILDKDKIKVFIAILWNRLNADRRKIYEKLKEKGFQFANLISPSAKVRGKIKGGNCWIHDYVIIQPESEIGEDCMIMAFSLVGAYSVIGAHCFMGTKSTVAGECKIGSQTFVGINCTVFDNTKVGEKCILGACTAVKRNLGDCMVVKTSDGNSIIKRVEEGQIESKLIFSLNVR